MHIRFTKMQGAGNDFVVLDETRGRLGLGAAHYRFLGDRHFGVGADQILTVRPSPGPGIDFEYIIHIIPTIPTPKLILLNNKSVCSLFKSWFCDLVNPEEEEIVFNLSTFFLYLHSQFTMSLLS